MVLKETLLSGEAGHDYLREGKVTYFAKSVLGRGRTSQDAQKNISYKTRPAARHVGLIYHLTPMSKFSCVNLCI